MIILEGYDNSGKSTLAALLHETTGFEVRHPGPAPKNFRDEFCCLVEQASNAPINVIQDRVTSVSSQVYQNKLFNERYMAWLNGMLNTPHCVLIYCRPPIEKILDFTGHQIKDYDTPEHLEKVKGKAIETVESYDLVMKQVPHIVYDWTRPRAMDDVIHSQTDFQTWISLRFFGAHRGRH